MKRFAIDFAVVALVLLAGFAVTGNLDDAGGYVFCVAFGLLFATVRLVVARARRAPRATSGS